MAFEEVTVPVITVSPSLTPEIISISLSDEIPISTGTLTSFPSFKVLTVFVPSCVKTAYEGTINTSVFVSRTMFAVAAMLGRISEEDESSFIFAE